MERLGIPAVAIMTNAFEEAARQMARGLNAQDYKFAVIGHPISSDDAAELREKARSAVIQARIILLNG